MGSRVYLFEFVLVLFIMVGLFGSLPFFTMGTRAVKKIGLLVGIVVILIGLVFAIVGMHEKKAASVQRVVELSPDAYIVQRLLRGEEVPIWVYHHLAILSFVHTAEKELKLPTEVVKKIGDSRRYTLHFNTNDTVVATNR